MGKLAKYMGIYLGILLCGIVSCMTIYGTINMTEIPQHTREGIFVVSLILTFAVIIINYKP